ncbi:MAG: acyltransferase, partial [Kiritimatiellae bacterium]|nr:acyltransferase [Kiritimatiellia bacterium]
LSCKEFTFARLARLHTQVLFYSIVPFLAVMLVCSHKTVPNVWKVAGHLPAVKAFFPIISNQWWFATDYFVLSVFSPFINRMLNGLAHREFSTLIGLVFVVFVGIPTTFGHLLPKPDQWFENNLAWFFVLYCIGAFFRRNSCLVAKCGVALNLAIAVGCLMFVCFAFSFGGLNFRGRQQFPVVLAAASLFLAFLRMNIRQSRFISVLAGSSFGVYLIHDHPMMREIIWNFVACSFPSAASHWFIPASMVAILGVYCVCVVAELSRKTIFRCFRRYCLVKFSQPSRVDIFGN